MTSRIQRALALIVVLPALLAGRQDGGERRVYVTVLDSAERPVRDLGAADFGIREDGRTGEIVRVEPAAEAPAIFLMADNSAGVQPFVNDVRLALAAFVKAIHASSPDATLALMAHGGPPTMLNGFTKDEAALQKAIRRFVPTTGASFLLESLVEAGRQLRSRPSSRRAIVCFAIDAVAEGAPPLPETIGRAVRDASAGVWVIALTGGPGDPNRDYVLNRVIPWSGGLRQTVVSPQALQGRFERLAELLLSQSVITYRRPAGPAPQQLDVGVREGLRVLATRWPPK
jgi:hypothetical protein